MSQEKAVAVAVLASCALGCLHTIADAAPTTPESRSAIVDRDRASSAHPGAGGKTDKGADNGDGAVFSEVIPTELEQPVTVKPSWLPLSKQLAMLQDATKVPLSLNVSVPDDTLFVAAPARTEFSLLRQMRLLLTDNAWRGLWVSKALSKESGKDASKDPEQDRHAYRLWREAVSPQEQRAHMAQAAKERLARLLALIREGPQAWDALRKDDPEMSNGIRQPVNQAPLLLAGELPPDELDAILMGQPLTLRIADMSPQDQALVCQSTGAAPSDNEVMVATDRTGRVVSTYYPMRGLNETGKLVFESGPLLNEPGSLGLYVTAYPEPDPVSGVKVGMGGDEMLHLRGDDFTDERQKIEARHRQEVWGALASKTPGSKTVTIDRATKPQEGEPPLAAYLRSFAEQTKLTVLAYWPQGAETLMDSKGLPKRLPASIVNRPAGEALDILCKTYGGEWVQDEATVRLRALPDRQPDTRKPAAPPAVPAAPPMKAP